MTSYRTEVQHFDKVEDAMAQASALLRLFPPNIYETGVTVYKDGEKIAVAITRRDLAVN